MPWPQTQAEMIEMAKSIYDLKCEQDALIRATSKVDLAAAMKLGAIDRLLIEKSLKLARCVLDAHPTWRDKEAV